MNNQESPRDLGLPNGWRATSIEDGMVVLHVAERFHHGEDPSRLSEGAILRRLPRPEGAESLSDYADKQMKRLVRQGQPDHSVDKLGDLEAQIYEWTDGTRRLITWFVEPDRGVWYRVDYGTQDPEVTRSELWKRAVKVLGNIQWPIPRARATSSA
jgi:hypothetical protein